MEYLVTMTTHVPDGTPEQAVQDIRTREARHSADLAAQGHLLRLWRPPLQPGSGVRSGCSRRPAMSRSRTCWPPCRCGCGAPMRSPRSRRTRTTRPASGAAPAGPGANGKGSEFLVTFTVTSAGHPGQTVADADAEEAQRAHDLAAPGHLLRLWTLPGTRPRWACGEPATQASCGISCRRCRWLPGRRWTSRRCRRTPATRRSCAPRPWPESLARPGRYGRVSQASAATVRASVPVRRVGRSGGRNFGAAVARGGPAGAPPSRR